jgi:hypothetical protein
MQKSLLIFSAMLTLFLCPVMALAQTAAPAPADPQEQQGKPENPRAKDTSGSASLREPYVPMTGRERWKWFVVQSVGPASLGVGLLSAGIATARDKPVEYGPHWDGFGDRYGMRLTGVVTGNAMNAGLGALWGEDPRYFRADGRPFKARVRNVIVFTFMARRIDGHLAPAYARYIATPGSNFLSNTWRVDSEATNSAALRRTALGFGGRLGANAFREFWPDVKKHLGHNKN